RCPDGFEGAEFPGRGGRGARGCRNARGGRRSRGRRAARGVHGGGIELTVFRDEVRGDRVDGRVLEQQRGVEGGADQLLQPLGGLEHVDRVQAEFVEADVGGDLRGGPPEVFGEHFADPVGHAAGPAGLGGGGR